MVAELFIVLIVRPEGTQRDIRIVLDAQRHAEIDDMYAPADKKG